MRQLRQGRPAHRQRPALLIQQLHAQRLHHPGAAIVGGATAYAENDRLHAAIQRRQHQFSGAVTGGDARIAPAGRRQVQPGGGGHFNHRGFSVAQQAIEPLYRLPSGPVTVIWTISPPVAATIDSTVPSPPSAIGSFT